MNNWEQFRKEKNGKLIPGNRWQNEYFTIKHKEWNIIFDIYTTSFGQKGSRINRIRTRIRVPISVKRELKFLIFKGSFINKLQKNFNMQRLTIGDEAFDNEFVIVGNDLQTIKELLSPDKIKTLFHDKLIGSIGTKDAKQLLFRERFPTGVEVLHFEVNDYISNKETLEDITLLITTVLDRLVAIQSIEAHPPKFTPKRTLKRRTIILILLVIGILVYTIKDKATSEYTVIEESITEETTPIKTEAEEILNEPEITTEGLRNSHNENQTFNINTIFPNGPSTIFNNATFYVSSSLLNVMGRCKEGDSITILDIGSLYTAEEQDQVQLSSNSYKVMYNDTEGYLKNSDLAMKQLDLGTATFLIGTDDINGQLGLKVFENENLIDKVVLMDRAYKINSWGTDYDLFNFQFNQIDNNDFKGLYFFNFTDENNGSDGWLQNRIYTWNGTTFKQITTNETIDNLIEFELIFPSDNNGIRDTLTYQARTGYMDESGDITEEKTHLFYFTLNKGILKQVSEE